MLILGVDPGLRATGYAFLQGLPGGVELVAHGLVRTEDDAPLANRLERIHGALFALLEQRRPRRSPSRTSTRRSAILGRRSSWATFGGLSVSRLRSWRLR